MNRSLPHRHAVPAYSIFAIKSASAFTAKPLAAAMLLAAALCASPVHAGAPQLALDVAAAPLDQALNQLARQSGTQILFASDIASGRSAPALKGDFTVGEALRRLLDGTGLAVQAQGDRTFTIVPADGDDKLLKPVHVRAGGVPEGDAEAGYRAETTRGVGPWAQRSLQDTPYSMTVMTSSLIENAVAGDMDQIYKLNPLTQNSAPSTVYDTPYAVMRGFHTQQGVIDGVRLSSALYGISMEEIERVEIFNGLTGFLYGPGNVGGTTNFVLKRPTAERRTDVSIGNYGGEQYFAHVDLGGPIDADGRFGYRLNAAYQDGDTEKDNQHLKKSLVSGALDWRATDDLLLQLEAAHRDYKLDGADSRFYFTGIKRPSSYDNDATHTPTWSYNDVETDRYGVNARWALTEQLTARAAYLYKQDKRASIYTYPLLQANNTFNVGVSKVAPNEMTAHGAYTYLDADFDTFGIGHKLTVGVSLDRYDVRQHADASSYNIFSGYDLDGIASLPEPATAAIGMRPFYTASKAENRNIVVGDDISFSEQWSALIGLNRSTLKNRSFNAAGAKTADYDKSDITPTLSLIYKPVPNASVYATYMEALEQGTIVGATYRNRDEVLDPMISKQYELGAKGTFGNVLLTAALFRIEKANQYSDDGTPTGKYVQDGLQVHQGLELSATGKLTDSLTLIAGGVWMDLSVEESNNPALEGKHPAGVAEKMAKLYAEYDVTALPGLTLSGGVFYTGGYYGDALNTDEIKSFVVGDIGARYATSIFNTPTTLRLNVTNVGGADYWATNYSLGIPRTVAFSVLMQY